MREEVTYEVAEVGDPQFLDDAAQGFLVLKLAKCRRAVGQHDLGIHLRATQTLQSGDASKGHLMVKYLLLDGKGYLRYTYVLRVDRSPSTGGLRLVIA